MESVIQVVRGDPLESSGSSCVFCDSTKDVEILGIITKKTFDGIIFKGFPICSEHKDKINALLSGEFDIDLIELEKYRKPAGKALRFRG